MLPLQERHATAMEELDDQGVSFMATAQLNTPLVPTLIPLGDSALVIKYADTFGLTANRAAIAMARLLEREGVRGALEIVPNLVSVLVRFDSVVTDHAAVAGEIRLLAARDMAEAITPVSHSIGVRFGGADGPDLDAAAEATGMSAQAFIAAHNEEPLRVLATGFAPGFVYCGMHSDALHLPRRSEVRSSVSAGSVIFAAGQTAIAATPIPTGWYVIGRTGFRNFDHEADPPTKLRPGDVVRFEVLS